ncbi:hypothetical protein [Pseudoalteromonas citrea]|uniref:hypothetical protein n=1 Tax=Pseudoalteromonas citrea TaxID=43655 RepID=UPI00110BB09E|nr:hypothetical protein [Pseudoalteromonas citrea]
MMAQSGHHPLLFSSHSQAAFLALHPHSFYQAQSRIVLHALPDATIRSLSKLAQPEIAFEWAIRLAKQGLYTRSRVYWQRYLNNASQAQVIRLVALLKAANDISAIALIASKQPLPMHYLDWLSLHRGVLPSAFNSERLAAHNMSSPLDSVTFARECINRVLVLTDHLAAVKKLKQFKIRYTSAPEPSVWSYCFSEPIYIGDTMQCTPDNSQFAYCDVAALKRAYPAMLPQGDKALMMTRQGNANVRGDMMTLNTQSQYAVFMHELMHFSGFEDEYSVPKQKAKWLCQRAGRHAPNLYVGELNDAPKGWVKSNTCNYGALQAYKPSEGWSIMEYQTRPLTAQYRRLWQQAINAQHAKRWVKSERLGLTE